MAARMTFTMALIIAKRDHQVRLLPDGTKSLGYRWSCSCGQSSPSRLVPPSRPMAAAAADRHINAAARKIQKER